MKVLITLLVASLMSISNTSTHQIDKEFLYGVWVEKDWGKEGIIYAKVAKLQFDKPGLKFDRKGALVKRQNVGWCGTPPISYGNNDGTWEWTSDDELTIKYSFWGGDSEEDWSIRSLSEDEMIVAIKDRRNDKRGR